LHPQYPHFSKYLSLLFYRVSGLIQRWVAMSKRRKVLRVVKKTIIPIAVIFMVLILWAGCDPNLPYQDPQPGVGCRWYFNSSADGLRIPCNVYLPNGYDPNHAYPVWLELHALYGKPLVDNNPANPFSVELRRLADEKGWILLAPWGRNLHSLFVDGMDRSQPAYYEPEIFDDFSAGAASWQTKLGTWQGINGIFRQSDNSPIWKEAVLQGSSGEDYSVRVRIKDLAPGGTTSAVGINLRRTPSGDCYHVDLYKGPDGTKYVRMLKYVGGNWENLYTVQHDWHPLDPWDGWVDLKFSCYEDYLEVYVNEDIVNMQPGYDATPYGYGREAPGTPLPAGEISLCSYGGVHEFDEVRVQNEYQYGEQDIIDCLLGAMEKYRIDPQKIYAAGHSMGGLGAYSLTLHYPDYFAAARPADGFSDIYYDYTWLDTYYPRNPGPPYADVNDGRLTEYMRTLVGGVPGPGHEDRLSVMNGSSARYILENGVNNFWRIVHGTPDYNVPNSYDPVTVCWWAPWWFTWGQSPAPAPYSPATATYANGKDIADLLQSWSSPGRYDSEYVTSPTIGHGFLEGYAETADFFYGKDLTRGPSEVAYKTYDDENSGAWWLRLEIPNPGQNQPGMARVNVDDSTNTAAVHARNLSELQLDLDWMGLDNWAGKTITLNIDDDTSPNVFPIADTTGQLDLELIGAWTDPSGYQLELDGAPLTKDSHYTIDGMSLLVPGLAVTGGHQLTVQAPPSLPANLAPNPGAETMAVGGFPANWTGEVYNGGTAYFLWDDLQRHDGGRSLRIKDANLTGTNAVAHWKSDPMAVTSGDDYLLGASAKARLLRGGEVRVGIAWYNSSGTLLDVDWSDSLNQPDETYYCEWTPLSVMGTAPAGSSSARIVAGIVGTSPVQTSGSAWFDGFSFTSW